MSLFQSSSAQSISDRSTANLIEFHQTYNVQQHRRDRSNSIKTHSFIEEVGQELLPFFEQWGLKVFCLDTLPSEKGFDHVRNLLI